MKPIIFLKFQKNFLTLQQRKKKKFKKVTFKFHTVKTSTQQKTSTLLCQFDKIERVSRKSFYM